MSYISNVGSTSIYQVIAGHQISPEANQPLLTDHILLYGSHLISQMLARQFANPVWRALPGCSHLPATLAWTQERQADFYVLHVLILYVHIDMSSSICLF